MNVNKNELLFGWIEADKRMREAVEAEIVARAALVNAAFPDRSEGTHSAPLLDGTVLKVLFKTNCNVDSKNVDGMLKKLPSGVRGGLFRWDASLSMTAYKALEPAHKLVANEVLTFKPGRPSVTIETPKER